MQQKNNNSPFSYLSEDLPYILLAIAVLGLCIVCLLNGYKRDEMDKRIAILEEQVIELESENQFLKDHYEQEIVMLDSQLLELECDLIEMKDGVELIKK